MDLLKKNLASIIMMVVAALGVVAVFVWPIPGLYTGPGPKSLTSELQASLGVGQRILTLLHGTHNLPNLSADNVDPKPLGGFPNDGVIQTSLEAIKQFSTQADKMLQAAVAANKHTLLIPNELPNPADPDRFNYAKAYLNETGKDEHGLPYSRWRKILNAGMRPTQQQVDDETAKLKQSLTASLKVPDPANNGAPDAASQKLIEQALTEQTPLIRPRLEMAVAQNCSLYLEDKALLGIDAKVSTNPLPGPTQIFDTQLAMWCLDDITKAIAQCNKTQSDSDSAGGQVKNDIIHAPIKLIEMIGAPVAIPGNGAPAGGPLPKDNTPTGGALTGRTCNALYDVVTYTVRLAVDGEKVPIIFRELQRGQFITITNPQILQVFDPAVETGLGFHWGDKACVELQFTVEELFMKQWSTEILPDQRKTNLGSTATGGGMMIDNGGAGDPNAPVDPSMGQGQGR